MPLHTTQSTQLGQLAGPTTDPKFLVFFASGQPSWCPDCRDSLPAVQNVFGTDPSTVGKGGDVDGYMIFVGDRPTWKDPENYFRKSYGIKCVPTIVKFSKGKMVARLEDVPDCADESKVLAFTRAS
ncbi:thioredoxin-like protein [Tilletiaria anomala UBC 951]|uniref:Thioredoxin-like protein n=1 Tax=Tilletiaria anomala (strain ATCC 24038 / CBS 436.72 / UBC 951) TaxID=1037660 RepID=A0A066WAB7_TILAU|nr:thioredoxin-like protein [Tilletiaria anomala UBC 951]KDN50867.1 thioredoxin-like protein [Tilletiaria anomala UBC 951]